MTRRYRMARRREGIERTRERIETALIRLLGEKPWGSITMADIARAARVSVRTVQRHYGSRDKLLTAVGRLPQAVLAGELAKRQSAASPEAGIRGLVEAVFAVFERYDAEVWTTHTRATDVPELGEVLSSGVGARREAIERLVAAWPGAWAAGSGEAARVLMTMTSYLYWRSLRQFGGYGAARAPRVASDHICRLLLR